MPTVSALYDSHAQAIEACRALENAGVSHDNISMVSNQEGSSYDKEVAKDTGTGSAIGAALGGAGGLLAGLGAIAIPGLGPVVAAGWLVSTAVGAGVGAAAGAATGGIVGALTEADVPEEEAQFYAEGIRRGGTLVTAKTSEGTETTSAETILLNHHAVDRTERSQLYRAAGWSAFDPSAQPYTRDEVIQERNRYTQK